MSMMAGIWHFDKDPIDPAMLTLWDQTLSQHGPDARGEFHESGKETELVMIHRALWVTHEDHNDPQPVSGRPRSGLAVPVLTFDGRLDNRDELLHGLHADLQYDCGDAALALAAWEQWGSESFRKLSGDWALALWDPRECRVILARDYVGARNLYYSRQSNRFLWCSHINTLVLHAGLDLRFSDRFVANYLLSPSSHPTLTPYEEILAVPAGTWVEVSPHNLRIHRSDIFCGWRPARYQTDEAYEEHFRYAFRQAVKRRMRTVYPILADLSGGLDSSSVVCMAYDILRRGESSTTINTLSCYSLEEPTGDERPFVQVIEDRIGKMGTHVEVKTAGKRLAPIPPPYFCGWPGYFARSLEMQQELESRLAAQGNRSHLTGIGGDELAGGVSDPRYQLAAQLASLKFLEFARSACRWSLSRKTTVFETVAAAAWALLPEWLQCLATALRIEQPCIKHWVRLQAVANRARPTLGVWQPLFTGMRPRSLIGYDLSYLLAGRLPPLVGTIATLYPFLDRDLAWFLKTIPAEQLVRPGKRRHLMRRALKDIVPEPVLSRKTKWVGSRQLSLQLLSTADTADSGLNEAGLSRYFNIGTLAREHARCLEGNTAPLLLLEHTVGLSVLRARLDSLEGSRHR